LDIDDTSMMGPETTFWASGFTPGRYRVCVEAYNSAAGRNTWWTLNIRRNGVHFATRTGVLTTVHGNAACTEGFIGNMVFDI
jgi:hypothetical protein